MKQKALPQMPYGQGSFKWGNKEQTSLRYYVHYKSKTDGNVYRLSVYGNSAKECIEKMNVRKAEKESEIQKSFSCSINNKNVSLGDALSDWLNKKKLNRVKARTYDRDEVTIENQIKTYPIAEKKVLSITGKEIADHLYFLQYTVVRKDGSVGYSYSTVKKTYEILKQFFEYYYSRNNVTNPMNGVPRPQQKKNINEISVYSKGVQPTIADTVLSDVEIIRFKEQAYLQGERMRGRSKYGVALYFILMTFIRVGEAISLVWSDIDFDSKTMRISKTTSRVRDRDSNISRTKIITTAPKTNNGTRIVMLNYEALEALSIIRKRSKFTKQTDFVIATDKGNRVSEDRLYLATKSILLAAGLNNDARDKCFGVHYLRHTGISYFLRHGVPVELVSKMAGHSSVSITIDIYYHIIHEQNTELLNKMNDVLTENHF